MHSSYKARVCSSDPLIYLLADICVLTSVDFVRFFYLFFLPDLQRQRQRPIETCNYNYHHVIFMIEIEGAKAVSAPNIGSRKLVSAYRSTAKADENKSVSVSALKKYQSIASVQFTGKIQ